LLVFFPSGRAIRKLADEIEDRLAGANRIRREEIQPQKQYGYRSWLWRSFLPGWKVPIRPVCDDLGDFDLLILGFPKWTVNCPPLTSYLSKIKNIGGKAIALFMTHGGFDEKRYLSRIVKKLSRKGARIVSELCVRGSEVHQDRHAQELARFAGDLKRG